ncbi:hypothetical protein AMECASPLE_035723 [Ameca splendens]|uniref:Uncharacterized protein n=1 Tax=Ameca splendens TaxID=208324 RepID=A0ABV1AH51_9TELE
MHSVFFVPYFFTIKSKVSHWGGGNSLKPFRPIRRLGNGPFRLREIFHLNSLTSGPRVRAFSGSETFTPILGEPSSATVSREGSSALYLPPNVPNEPILQ